MHGQQVQLRSFCSTRQVTKVGFVTQGKEKENEKRGPVFCSLGENS